MKSNRRGSIKCLVWDLDNTVWDGILAEGDNLKLRDGVVSFLHTLDQRGIVHSIISKNNYEDAWGKLTELKIDKYFVCPQISWNPKSHAITAIKEKLNIGFEAIAFVDDQAFERDEVAFSHPEVRVFTPDIVVNGLQMEEFMPRFVSPESTRRRQMYLDDEKRNVAKAQIGDNVQFLVSLDMELRINKATEYDLGRMEELTIRTNQMNSSGNIYSYEDLKTLIHSPTHKCLVAQLTDKYGDYGKIGLAVVECGQAEWTIKMILVSCRVMDRGIGTVLLYAIINTAAQGGYNVQAEFRSTGKNRQMLLAFKLAGLVDEKITRHGAILLKNPEIGIKAFPFYIRVKLDPLCEADRYPSGFQRAVLE